MKALFIGALLLCACPLGWSADGPRTGSPQSPQRGLASWYAENKPTASGEKFNASSLTAAHKTLPFGTMVKVTNLSTHCAAVVRINDRGPYKKGRIIDVSKAAAQQLKMIGSGIASVQIEVVGPADR